MDGPGEHYAKRNEPVRKRQIPYDLTNMWNLMNKTNKQNRDRVIKSRLTAVRVEVEGAG